jgi:probable F420-dependent oxidoreductase
VPKVRPFRFAALAGRPESRQDWLTRVRRIEEWGYSTVVLGHHLAQGSVAPFAALATAAAATSLRVATHVIPTPMYPPAILAHEAATLDLLSDGRLELGLGAGWGAADFAVAGLPLRPAAERLARLEEEVAAIKALLGGEASAPGAHHPALGPIPDPRPVQRPHPPIFVGGGGRRALGIAARLADIVGLDLRSTADGRMDLASYTADHAAQQVAWVREAAGARFAELELSVLVHGVFVGHDRAEMARRAADFVASVPDSRVKRVALTPEQIAASPHILTGSADQVADALRERRERLGISYVSIYPPSVEAFAPIAARLRGE